MIRLVIYIVFTLVVCLSTAKAQSTGVGGVFNKSSISVGEMAELTIKTGVTGGSYSAGELNLVINLPKYYTTSNVPEGCPFNWSSPEVDGSGLTKITGVLNATISSEMNCTLVVEGKLVSPPVASLQNGDKTALNVDLQFASDVDGALNNQAFIPLGITAPNTISVTANPTNPISGTSVELTATGCVSGTYTWLPAGGATSGADGNTYTVTATTTTITYTATCSTGGTGAATVAGSVPNTISVTANPTNPISGTSVELTATGCVDGSYTWSPSTGSPSGTNGNMYTVVASTTPVTYTVTCSTGGSATATVTGSVPNTISVTANPTNPISGTSVELTATGCVDGSYTWSPSTGSPSGTNGNMYTVVASTTPVTYTVTCSTGGSATATVTGSVPNTISVTANPTNPVSGTSVVLTATGCVDGSYTWSPSTGSPSGTNGNIYTVVASTTPVTYTVTCTSGGTATTIVEGSVPNTISVTANPTNPISGNSVVLTATGCVDGSYTWSPSTGSPSGTNGNIYTVVASTTPVTYTVTCTSGGTATTTVEGSVPNTISVTANPTNPISGNSVVLTATGCVGGTFTWTPAGGTANGDTYTVIATTTSTTYTATCSTGGTGTAVVTGSVPDAFTVSPATQNVAVGTSVTLTTTGCNGGIINWSNGSTGVSITFNAVLGNTTYTAICSTTNQEASAVVTGSEVVVCPANAGTLD